MMKSLQSKIFTLLGVICIICAVGITAFNIYDAEMAEKNAGSVSSQLKTEIPTTSPSVSYTSENEPVLPAYVLNPDMEMPVKSINGRDYIGLLEIPAFGLSLPVLSELTYAGLRVSPARYKGSAYSDDLIIGAHNYTSHFSNLRNLTQGDEIIFTDIDGNVFRYTVSSTETLLPTSIEEMVSGDWELTLFTCTFGGSYRITVRCERVLN